MGDILVTSIWNRIMIVNFGFPALPVGSLIALRYLLSPLSLYAGFRSDRTTFLGMRRTSYIWLGRALMVASFPLLGFSITLFDANRNDSFGWALAFLSFLMYGSGTLLSGSPFLALVRDSMPKARQGLALSVVETALILCFPLAAISFSLLLKEYTLAGFWELIVITALVGGFFWVFAIAGVEKRSVLSRAAEMTKETTRAQFQEFRSTFGKIWQDPRARAFMLFLSVATFAAWTQEAILEPFGAEVLNASLEQTTRYSSYWQGATAILLVFFALAWQLRSLRRHIEITLAGGAMLVMGGALLALAGWQNWALPALPVWIFVGIGVTVLAFGLFSLAAGALWKNRLPEHQIPISQIGLGIMGVGMLLLALTSFSTVRWIVNPALLVFGIGFGFYTFSAFNLLVVMTSDRAAGAYLGLWTVTILLTRGVGILAGGGLRDVLHALTQSFPLTYGVIFGAEGLLLLVSILLLARVNVISFARDTGRISSTDAQVIVGEI
jgi:BCD family chlorophyll transporter-like MFS transporter